MMRLTDADQELSLEEDMEHPDETSICVMKPAHAQPAHYAHVRVQFEAGRASECKAGARLPGRQECNNPPSGAPAHRGTGR